MGMGWYVVHTYSGYENRAKLGLEDRINRAPEYLQERFGEVLVPTEKVVEVKDGQKKTSTRKIYPGYMFVQMIVDKETFHLVKGTPKITGFIGGSTNPPPIPDDEVRRITNQVAEAEAGEDAPKSLITFDRGEEISIIDGPFASMCGKVEEVNAGRAKLRVMVSIFGRPTSVELDFTQVERLG